MAPNVFHVGVIEQVSITIFDADSPVNVMLYLKNHKRGTPFYRVQGRVKQGKNMILSYCPGRVIDPISVQISSK